MREHISRTLANPKATRLLIALLFVGLAVGFAVDPVAADNCHWIDGVQHC